MNMTLFSTFYFILAFYLLHYSNIEKINTNNDAKSLQMETFLIDGRHHFKSITITQKETDYDT